MPGAMIRTSSIALLAAAALAAAMAVARAAGPADAPAATGGIDAQKQQLDAKRNALSRSRDSQKAIAADIAALSGERAELSSELVATGTRIRSVEEAIATGEDHLARLDAQEADITRSLERRRTTIAQLLAGLERLGRHPPPALLVSPGDAVKSIRSAILLGAILPEMRDDATQLAADLADLAATRRAVAAEQQKLEAGRADLAAAHKRLTVLIAARQDQLGARQKALADVHDQIASLGKEVTNLQDLIQRSEAAMAKARAAAPPPQAAPGGGAAAGRTGPGQGSPQGPGTAAGPLGPAIAFADERGRLPQPVNGTRIKGFGDPDGFGGEQKGVSISTRAGAEVTSPCDGRVVYAGPFRSYGQLLILNAGGGYHVLLAGMKKLSVELGQFVLTGEPVAEMGEAGSPLAAATNGDATQPVLYVEFRKDGAAVDPGPWWASNSSEKVRG
ncbi:MAG TPA: peptidoglycan DD-metalloendopeptidase family protein [Hyphomicrobiales bacterium]|nr:peptidoglycan DD-metalloendopeptidase family protein [Hyphomicrobiales bacterium]